MTPWQAVVFDLDDTLYPERDFISSGFRAVAEWAKQHVAASADRCYRALEELSTRGERTRVFDRWLESCGESLDLVPEMVRVYREHEPEIQPFPGVAELLSALAPQCRLGLLSDGYLDVQRNKLRALGIADRFKVVVFSDEYGRDAWKPSERPFRVALEGLGVEPCDAIYVGDNPKKDFLPARMLGMAAVQCRHSGGDYVELDAPSSKHAPDYVVRSVDELGRLLLNGDCDAFVCCASA